MEDKIENKIDFLTRITQLVEKKKKIFLTILLLIIIGIISITYINYLQSSDSKRIAEKYILAGVYLASNDKDKSRIIYKEIIYSKNKFYSLLSLNSILDNNLEENNIKILELFNAVEKNNLSKEQKNLIKLKKGLYLKNISRDDEGDNLFKEIIAENSIWKETVKEILK